LRDCRAGVSVNRMRFALLPLFFACLAPSLAMGQVSLEWPVACKIGATCEIQHYVDRVTGSGAQDYRCGTATYDGHNGTDIRLSTLAAERAGVHVLAAATGRLLRARDDMGDVSIRLTGRAAVQGRECGNGLVLAHGSGLETQYCHMAKGSLVVRPGQMVAAGQILGHVGLSGDTEFPHLHITVRQNGQVVDPFALGEPAGACSGGTSLWAPALMADLAYKAGAVLNAGFATRQVTAADIEDGIGQDAPNPDAPALVAFVRAISLRDGDVQQLELSGPDGPIAQYSAQPLNSNKDEVYVTAGRKRPPGGWSAGTYTASFRVLREGRAMLETTFRTTMAPRL
jgi:hypothetical protein